MRRMRVKKIEGIWKNCLVLRGPGYMPSWKQRKRKNSRNKNKRRKYKRKKKFLKVKRKKNKMK